MTDWPDDWFRDGAAGARGASTEPPTVQGIGAGVNQPADAHRAADPTVQVGQGGYPAGATDPAGRPLSADQVTAPGTVGTAGSPGTGRAGGSFWPEQPVLRTPGSPRAGGFGNLIAPRRPGLTGWRRWLRPRPIAIALAAVLSLVIILGATSYFYLDAQLTRANVLAAYAGQPAQGDGTTWLVTGSDSRQGLTPQQIRQFSTGFGISGSRSDTIMLVHVPSGGGRPVLMSIPRDSWVDIPGYGYNKINAAYAFGGPKLLAQTIQNVTHLRIDHYMGIGFGGFVRLVNSIGGVRICLKTPLIDPASGLHLSKGCHTLSGGHALGFVRSRHQFATQDLQRIQNQRIFLRALLRKLTSPSVALDPLKAFPAAVDVADSLVVDKNTNLIQLLAIARALRNPITTTAPVANPSYLVNGQDAVLLDATKLAELINALNTGHPIPKGLLSGSTLSG